MHKISILILTIAALGVPTGLTGGQVQAAPLLKGCAVAGYSHNAVVCVVVPSHGTFALKIPQTKDTLKGTGAKSMAGAQITVIHVPPPVSSRGGYGLRVRANHKFSPLHLSSGHLYKFDPSANSLHGTKLVSGSGLYQVIH